jgi:hypothetical protein
MACFATFNLTFHKGIWSIGNAGGMLPPKIGGPLEASSWNQMDIISLT